MVAGTIEYLLLHISGRHSSAASYSRSSVPAGRRNRRRTKLPRQLSTAADAAPGQPRGHDAAAPGLLTPPRAELSVRVTGIFLPRYTGYISHSL